MRAWLGGRTRRVLQGGTLSGVAALLWGCTLTYTVDSFDDAPDANPGDNVCARAAPPGTGSQGLCTLRAAIMEANASQVRNRIEVPAGTYNLDLPVSDGGGALVITRGVQIRGAGASSTVIDAGSGCEGPARHRVFQITGGSISISYLTVQGGNSSSQGGGIWVSGGSLQLRDAVVRDNFAFTGGGGLRISSPASATVRRTSIVDNCTNGAFGGGIWSHGDLRVHESLIANNEGNRAGGIRNSGTMNLRSTTVSGNFVSSPEAGVGGISQQGFAFLNNVTITNNTGRGTDLTSFRGGGIQTDEGQITVIKNSIIAGNDGAGGPIDCVGELTPDSRHNLIGHSEGCEITGSTATFLLDVDPGLGALANNGGPTRTHQLSITSPARNAGYPFPPPAADACEPWDQRGVPRPQGDGICDLGAVEAGGANLFVTSFVLVNADANTDIQPLRNGELLNLGTLPRNLSIRAVVQGFPGSVVFDFNGVDGFQTENVAPYALGGDSPVGNYHPVALPPGANEVRATPYANSNGGGAAGGALTVMFDVVGAN